MTHENPQIALCFHRALLCSANQIGRLYNQALAPTGLRGYEFGLLRVISQARSIGIIELADAFLYDRATLRYRLAPLEKAGFVALVLDPRDARVRKVELTAAGNAKLAEASVHWKKAQDRFETLVGKREAVALRATAARIASPTFADSFSSPRARRDMTPVPARLAS